MARASNSCPGPGGGDQYRIGACILRSWELRNQPRSVDYAFTLAEIHLTKDGKGEGKLVPAAKIAWNKDTRTIEIENYGTEPVRLTEVTVEK
ncbi:MAG TPA: hypothetical protein VGL15_06315 [Vicinamibacteria bacterium]